MQLEDGELEDAGKSLGAALNADPFDAPSLLSRARLYVKEGNKEKAIPIYRTLTSRDDSTPEMERELNEITIQRPEIKEEPADTPDENDDDVGENDFADIGNTYDLALLALKRAYGSGNAVSDSRMLTELGINGKKRTAVLNYLSNIEEYGEIDVRSKEFERMERLSKNVIISENIDDIDSNPLIGIPAAYMASSAETIDDAKKLIAYIYKVMTDDSEPVPFSEEVRDALAEAYDMSGDITTYTIMRMFNVGVHTARTVGRLAKMSKKGIDMHI